MYMYIYVHVLDYGCVGRVGNQRLPFSVLKAGYSVSYSCVCDVCRDWFNEVNFFLKIPVWLVCYAHVFHDYMYIENMSSTLEN